MTEKRKPGIGERDALCERRADQQHRRRFASTLSGEARGGIFRFTEHVGDFIFAADIRKALDFSRACGRQEYRSTGSELGLHVFHAGYDIAVKARAGPRGKLELRCGPDSQRKLFDMNLRSFFQGRRKFLF